MLCARPPIHPSASGGGASYRTRGRVPGEVSAEQVQVQVAGEVERQVLVALGQQHPAGDPGALPPGTDRSGPLALGRRAAGQRPRRELPAGGGQDDAPVVQRRGERQRPGGAPVEPGHLRGGGAADLGEEPGQRRGEVAPREVDRRGRDQLQALPGGRLGEVQVAVAEADDKVAGKQDVLPAAPELADADHLRQHLRGAAQRVRGDPGRVERQLRQLRPGVHGGQADDPFCGLGEHVPEPSRHRPCRAGDGVDAEAEVSLGERVQGAGLDLGADLEVRCQRLGRAACRRLQPGNHVLGQGHGPAAFEGGGAGEFQQQPVAQRHRPGRLGCRAEPVRQAEPGSRADELLQADLTALAPAGSELGDVPLPLGGTGRVGCEPGQDSGRGLRLGGDRGRQPHPGVEPQVDGYPSPAADGQTAGGQSASRVGDGGRGAQRGPQHAGAQQLGDQRHAAGLVGLGELGGELAGQCRAADRCPGGFPCQCYRWGQLQRELRGALGRDPDPPVPDGGEVVHHHLGIGHRAAVRLQSRRSPPPAIQVPAGRWSRARPRPGRRVSRRTGPGRRRRTARTGWTGAPAGWRIGPLRGWFAAHAGGRSPGRPGPPRPGRPGPGWRP